MKQLKRILGLEQFEELKKRLRELRFRFEKRGVEQAYYYTSNGRYKIHFLFRKECTNYSIDDEWVVQFHIDRLLDGYHKVSTNRRNYERVLKWLNLPPELGFDLVGAFLPPEKRVRGLERGVPMQIGD